jgi:signal transduction histidine kinase
MLNKKIAVEVNGQTIAWILPDTGYQFKLSAEEQLFLQRTTFAIGIAALAGVLAAVAMGFLLSDRLLKPIRRLTQASQALARGELQQQVPVTSQDELGQLTTTFNQMSADLVQADQQRKRMTADITHDLSTPLQIIAGYIEMLEEDTVTLTPQRIQTIKTEIENLRRLVGDLSTLSQVEAGGLELHLQPVPSSTLMQRIYHAYQPIAARQGVDLALEALEPAPSILVDEGRMLQVLKNLVDNALRYTPTGGKITLSTIMQDDRVLLQVGDSGSGIDLEDLPYVFDRFYRADKARSANSGKMGLGLAICKALVVAQGGAIAAESDGKDLGTRVTITFTSVTASEPS